MGWVPEGAAGPSGIHGDVREEEQGEGWLTPLTSASYSASVGFCFFICKMGTMTTRSPPPPVKASGHRALPMVQNPCQVLCPDHFSELPRWPQETGCILNEATPGPPYRRAASKQSR